MKSLLFGLGLILLSQNSFAVVKKDECFKPIAAAVSVIAAENSKVIGMEAKLDPDYYQIQHQGFFVELNGIKTKDKGEDRKYRVRIDNGMTYQYWEIGVITRPDMGLKGCMIDQLKSTL
jgi:predicted small secreted protein